jgi:hypothetical protein
MEHANDKLDTCLICGEEMLYWQLQNHTVIYHLNIERWNYTVGGTVAFVCSQCAQTIIGNYDLKQIDWKHWAGQDDGTELEHNLWQSFKQGSNSFRCAPCWERNH